MISNVRLPFLTKQTFSSYEPGLQRSDPFGTVEEVKSKTMKGADAEPEEAIHGLLVVWGHDTDFGDGAEEGSG